MSDTFAYTFVDDMVSCEVAENAVAVVNEIVAEDSALAQARARVLSAAHALAPLPTLARGMRRADLVTPRLSPVSELFASRGGRAHLLSAFCVQRHRLHALQHCDCHSLAPLGLLAWIWRHQCLGRRQCQSPLHGPWPQDVDGLRHMGVTNDCFDLALPVFLLYI